VEIFTIGFTKTPAADFFGKLTRAGVRRLVDVRLNNTSQLAGFAKRDDLTYFLREICGITYEHEPLLTPTKDILDAYKKHKGDWATYEEAFLRLIEDREIEKQLRADDFATPSALLCSELTAQHCHRRLVLEYLARKWPDLRVTHL
jgi:uncharacterized protein (DUF488 family)